MLKTKGKHTKYTIIIVIILIFFLILFLKVPHVIKKKKELPPEQKIEEVKPEIKEKVKYRIAIIIDDVGYPSNNLNEYKNFKGKLTFAVLPFLKESKEHANILYDHGFEILIHIPMEPLNYPQTDAGQYALLSNNTKQEIEKKLMMMIEDNPHAVGTNNHMGSRATQEYQPMLWTLGFLKDKNLFFIDSLTTADSCAYAVALKLNVDTAKRDIFLDNEDTFSSINAQFEKLKGMAKVNGTAIGIGHINKNYTIKVLNYQLPILKKENYTLIFASNAVM